MSVQPGSHNYWIKVDAAGHQLRADAAASYLRLIKAGMPADGVQVFRRTFEAQEVLYNRYKKGIGPIAAPPSWRAPHIQGIAMDFYTSAGGSYAPRAAFKWMMAGMKGNPASAPRNTVDTGARAHAYGWSRTVPSERWHFGYNRAKDTKRAADLAARLKALGYNGLRAFQRANGLKDDNIDGPATWYKLLTAKPSPPPVYEQPPAKGEGDGVQDPAPKPVNRDFRFAQVNWEADRFDADSDKDGKNDEWTPEQAEWAKEHLNTSLMAFQELPELGRKPFYSGYGGSTKAYVLNYLGVMARTAQWKFLKRKAITFDNRGIHGAVRATLKEPITGREIDVISVHVRPKASLRGTDAQKLEAKKGDVRDALGLVRKCVPTIFAGDVNTGAAWNVINDAKLDLKPITAKGADTVVDEPGAQPLDVIFATAEFVTRKLTKVRNPHSDHYVWLWQGTLIHPDNTN